MKPPTFDDVLRARTLLSDHLAPTPARRYSALDATTGASVVVKHENTQPTSAFKVRGGITLLAGLSADERVAGLVGYSTGNHAQSLAYASALFGARCVIVMPENPNPAKAAAVEALGVELVTAGATFDDARVVAGKLAADQGMRLVSAANEPAILAGVGTLYAELLEAEPELDTVVVPVGSGSGAAAACLVAAELAPDCEVIAVQSWASPAAHDSWRSGACVERPNRTRVDGLATGRGFELTQHVLRDHLTDFLLVDDDDIAAAQWVLMRDAHTLAEGAGAAALAGVLANRERFAGRRVGVVVTGANAGEAELRSAVR